jgi:acyl-CoA reductase-like NAD-dependent aldehyde dehydrogenase
MEQQGATRSDSPRVYTGFDGQYINGSWRPGGQRGKLKDSAPYSGETVAEIVMANESDLDEAYQCATKAQIEWAKTLPFERAAVMLRSASIMEARHEEIVDWANPGIGQYSYQGRMGMAWRPCRHTGGCVVPLSSRRPNPTA